MEKEDLLARKLGFLIISRSISSPQLKNPSLSCAQHLNATAEGNATYTNQIDPRLEEVVV